MLVFSFLHVTGHHVDQWVSIALSRFTRELHAIIYLDNIGSNIGRY